MAAEKILIIVGCINSVAYEKCGGISVLPRCDKALPEVPVHVGAPEKDGEWLDRVWRTESSQKRDQKYSLI